MFYDSRFRRNEQKSENTQTREIENKHINYKDRKQTIGTQSILYWSNTLNRKVHSTQTTFVDQSKQHKREIQTAWKSNTDTRNRQKREIQNAKNKGSVKIRKLKKAVQDVLKNAWERLEILPVKHKRNILDQNAHNGNSAIVDDVSGDVKQERSIVQKADDGNSSLVDGVGDDVTEDLPLIQPMAELDAARGDEARAVAGMENMEVVGSVREGRVAVTLTHARCQDAGRYFCASDAGTDMTALHCE